MTAQPSFAVRWAFAAVAVLALSAAGGATAGDAPFAFDATPGRLPKTVVPLGYALTIEPRLRTLTLRGSERVILDVRRATGTLVFNALNLRFGRARIDGRAVRAIIPDDRSERTRLVAPSVLQPGRHVLDLEYTGRLETTGQGMFAQNYRAPGGKTGVLVSTQFESTDARRMFACWDEPAFRARFALTLVIPAAWQTVSNMPIAARAVRGATATVRFAPTPPMPTYLLEATAGDIAHIGGTDAAGTRHEVWAVRGQERDGTVALANSKAILAAYDAYFGLRFPLPRLASIAIPGGFDGAMENWGAITYNDQVLLLGPHAALDQDQDVYATQAHEMAHQWFGDLVTMAWWDDLWLNESFASWMAAKQTALAHPRWNWWQNQDADKETAMNADARLHTHPIRQPVRDDVDAEAAFDAEITYSKGQAFLRMLEAYLGPDVFRTGIRAYIGARKYSNATGADLWQALTAASDRPVGTLANAWIERPGFPLVTVSAACAADGSRTIALHQERFLLDGDDPTNPLWPIPVGIAAGSGPPAYTLLTQRDRGGIPAGRCDQPLRANAGNVGFYRVAYDPATLAFDREHFAALPDDDKIALLDDQWALVGAGKARLSSYLGLATAMGDATNARAWEQIADALVTIDRYEAGMSGETAFAGYARGVLASPAARIGFDARPNEGPATTQLRHTLIADLGELGDRAAIAWARLQFERLTYNRDSVEAGDAEVALRIAGAYADPFTFDRMNALARTASDETEFRRYAHGLAAARDPQLAARALKIAVSAEIPAQAQSERLAMIYTVAERHPALSYRFLQDHAGQLFTSSSVEDSVDVAQEIPEVYWAAAPLDRIAAWVTAHTPPEAAPELARGIERARFRVAVRARLDAQADALETAAAQ